MPRGRLTLRIITVRGLGRELECDSVRLSIEDGADGNGGGCLGIRPGHIRSLLALSEGRLTALTPEPISFMLTGGFATVDNDVVTVLADSFENE